MAKTGRFRKPLSALSGPWVRIPPSPPAFGLRRKTALPFYGEDPLPCSKEGGACAQMLLRGKPTVSPLMFPLLFEVI